jgi:hypothetical protein
VGIYFNLNCRTSGGLECTMVNCKLFSFFLFFFNCIQKYYLFYFKITKFRNHSTPFGIYPSTCHSKKAMRSKLKCKVPVGPKAPRRSAISRRKNYGPSVLLLGAKREKCQPYTVPPGKVMDPREGNLHEAQKIQARAIKALKELRALASQMEYRSRSAAPCFQAA